MVRYDARCTKADELKAELLLKKAEASLLSEECATANSRYKLLLSYVTKLEEKLANLEAQEQLNRELYILKGKLGV